MSRTVMLAPILLQSCTIHKEHWTKGFIKGVIHLCRRNPPTRTSTARLSTTSHLARTDVVTTLVLKIKVITVAALTVD